MQLGLSNRLLVLRTSCTQAQDYYIRIQVVRVKLEIHLELCILPFFPWIFCLSGESCVQTCVFLVSGLHR